MPGHQAPRPQLRLDDDPRPGHHGRARRPVRGRPARRRPGVGPADGVDAGPLPGPRLLLQRAAPAPVCPATTCSPASRPTSACTPSSSPTRSASTWSRCSKVPEPGRRRGAPRPRVPLRRPAGPARRDHHPPRRPPGRDREAASPSIPARTAWDISVRPHWSRPWHEIADFMQRAAVGETLAHIVLLENHERVRREGAHPGALLPARPALTCSAAGSGASTRPASEPGRTTAPLAAVAGGGDARRPRRRPRHDHHGQDHQRVVAHRSWPPPRTTCPPRTRSSRTSSPTRCRPRRCR